MKTEPLSFLGQGISLKVVFQNNTLQPRLLKMTDGDRGWFMEATMNTVLERGPGVVSAPDLA